MPTFLSTHLVFFFFHFIYLPLVIQICLVADEDDDNIVASLGSYIVDPLEHGSERVAVCTVWRLVAALGK